MWGQLSIICSNVLKQPNRELIVAINHNQLRTMASETVDPIDWLHPPPSWAVPLERLMHSINQCNLSRNRTCNRSMRGNHLAYSATFLNIRWRRTWKFVFSNSCTWLHGANLKTLPNASKIYQFIGSVSKYKKKCFCAENILLFNKFTWIKFPIRE